MEMGQSVGFNRKLVALNKMAPTAEAVGAIAGREPGG